MPVGRAGDLARRGACNIGAPMRHVVPCLVFLLGCSRMHGREEPAHTLPPAPYDAGREPSPGPLPWPPDPGDAAPLPAPDAGPLPVDAGPPPICPPQRASAACLESFRAEPHRAFELPMIFDTCAC